MKQVLFKTEMVQAILDGRKTQTRRIIKPQPEITNNWYSWNGHWPNSEHGACGCNVLDGFSDAMAWRAPFGKVGDHLWVRETWGVIRAFDDLSPSIIHHDTIVGYKTDPTDKWYQTGFSGDAGKWRSSIHMPRWASRITLKITSIKIQYVQEITTADAKAEGVKESFVMPDHVVSMGYVHAFRELWDSINSDRGFGWDKNPWVWVIEFEAKVKP